MFTFIIQLIDLIKLNQVGLFFVFFVCSWTTYLIKLLVRYTRDPLHNTWYGKKSFYRHTTVSAIVPVVDEPIDVWARVLTHLKNSLVGFEASEVIVVANGHNGKQNIKLAEDMGFKVIRLPNASKRLAIQAGVNEVKYDITVILDSDTVVNKNSIKNLVRVFDDTRVGGATPKHFIAGRNRNLTRRISDWLEDVRFEEVVSGQSSFGTVSCLPGRLLAIRSDLLWEITPDLVSQTFLGKKCFSGDDRFLTSELLRMGYKTVYVKESLVETEAPDTLKGFALQRLRWSRTSLRESLRSLPWTFKYPFMTFTVFSTLIMRWFFFAVIVTAIMSWIGLIDRSHFLDLSTMVVVLGTIGGYFVSGLLKNLRHLIKYPKDIVYLPVFLLVSTFILTPIEWFGNLTLVESGWMTRRTD